MKPTRIVDIAVAIVMLAVGLLLLHGCGPSYVEQMHAQEAARQAALCQADPVACAMVSGWLAQEQAAQQPVYVQSQPQRVFIQRWHQPGTPFNNAPLGYFDLP